MECKGFHLRILFVADLNELPDEISGGNISNITSNAAGNSLTQFIFLFDDAALVVGAVKMNGCCSHRHSNMGCNMMNANLVCCICKPKRKDLGSTGSLLDPARDITISAADFVTQAMHDMFAKCADQLEQ
jgi:hypothetical protein